MARKFLYIFACVVVLVIAAAFAYRVWGDKLLAYAMVPDIAYAAPTPRTATDYADARLWFQHGSSHALPLPGGAARSPARSVDKQAAIFFVHPTSYMNRAAWNAPDGDPGAEDIAHQYIAAEANVFDGLGTLWAPRYRQATFGAFLTDKPEAAKALDAAYGDVAAAFDAFLAANPRGPIILAAHSQGSRHLMRLLSEKVAGKPVAARIVAAYLVGWPISTSADLPALGLPACASAEQAHCVLSWQSFAPPAEPDYILKSYDAGAGLTGKPRRGTPMLCINPLIGKTGSAPASASAGVAMRDEKTSKQTLVRPGIGAACDRLGFLMLDSAPALGSYVLPGNNYHVYDYALFWANVRADAARRLGTFLAH